MDNEPLSGLTHLLATMLSIAGLVLLIVFGVQHGGVWHIVSFSIFGASLILLYLASTLYHFIPKTHKAKRIFKKIDYSMIYLLIAGTYTPVALVALRGGWGWSILGVVIGLAALGITLQWTSVWERTSTTLYLLMGWLSLIALNPLLEVLDAISMAWLVSGGIFYTVGVIFYLLDDRLPRTRWFGMHEVFHVFVILGSLCHFWLMFSHILYI